MNQNGRQKAETPLERDFINLQTMLILVLIAEAISAIVSWNLFTMRLAK